jgi:hypothetical protein
MTTLTQISETQAQKATTANENFAAVSPAGLFGRKAATTSGLTWGYFGGILYVDGVATSVADGTVALTANQTNYLEATRAGTVSANITGFTAGRIPLYTIVAGASTISSYTDYREHSQVFRRSFAYVSLAGSPSAISLTAAQARCDALELRGGSSGAKLIVPQVPNKWFIYNNSGFDVTVTTNVGGSPTPEDYVITNGTIRLLFTDGTNVRSVVVSGINETIIDAKGDIIVGTAADTAARKAAPSDGSLFLADSSQSDGWVASDSAAARKNLLLNGNAAVAQRGSAFTSASTYVNNDDSYLIDQWILLSDGNDAIDLSVETSVIPTGAYTGFKLDIETANKKAGLLQIIEKAHCHRALGGTVSLSFQARKAAGNATVDKLRAAIIAWSSTADAVTSDVVSAWGAEGANPTLVANWTYENTPSDLTLTDAFQTFTIENISVDTASAANIGVFIWIDNSDGTVGDLVYIGDVQLEIGAVATKFEQRPIAEEQYLCRRYFRDYLDVANAMVQVCNYSNGTTQAYTTPSFVEQPFRTTPTVAAVGSITLAQSNGIGSISATFDGATYRNAVSGSNFVWSTLGSALTAGVPYWVYNFRVSAEL